jgi:hypothetical protein
MDSSKFHTVTPAEVAGQPLILIETDSHWVLAPKLEPDLEPGTLLIYNDQLWSITWTSDTGFGDLISH